MIFKIKDIRNKCVNGEYRITKHAQRRCDSRNISLTEIREVVSKGKIIKTYPKDTPYPSCLVLGYVREATPLYVLCAVGELIHIITVHWLDPAKWLDPETRREKKP